VSSGASSGELRWNHSRSAAHSWTSGWHFAIAHAKTFLLILDSAGALLLQEITIAMKLHNHLTLAFAASSYAVRNTGPECGHSLESSCVDSPASQPSTVPYAGWQKGVHAFLVHQNRHRGFSGAEMAAETCLHRQNPALLSVSAAGSILEPRFRDDLRGAPFPEKPGIEEAFAYACLQDMGAYAFADTLLRKLDAMIAKMTEPDSADRYSAIYQNRNGKGNQEIGTSGQDPMRVKQVIEAAHPSEGVSLREKMYLIHSIMVWVPEEMQRRAGIETYKSKAEMKEREAAMTEGDRKMREAKLQDYVDSLGLDFPVSISKLEGFSGWRRNSPTIDAFHRIGEVPPMTGLATNVEYFEPRTDVRQSPWTLRERWANGRHVDLAQWDPEYASQAAQGSLDRHVPNYESIDTPLLNGSCYYTVNGDDKWFRENKDKDNFIVMTGPSGTADFFVSLMNIFNMPAEEKVAGIKALIGHMHVDNHHSLHEVLAATEGDKELNQRFRYDGTRRALEQGLPDIHAQAKALQPQFVAREVALRNRLDAERSAAFPAQESADLD
jgi:hypothetical protein